MDRQSKALFVCYGKCSTCARARQWLVSHGVAFEERDIREQNPTEAELRAWAEKSARPPRRFFNTSGVVYRALGLSKKLAAMDEDELYRLLASDGMLVKRPVLVAGETVLVGFDAAAWEKALP